MLCVCVYMGVGAGEGEGEGEWEERGPSLTAARAHSAMQQHGLQGFVGGVLPSADSQRG